MLEPAAPGIAAQHKVESGFVDELQNGVGSTVELWASLGWLAQTGRP